MLGRTFINRYKVIVYNVAVIDTVLFCDVVYHLTLLQSPGRALVHDYGRRYICFYAAHLYFSLLVFIGKSMCRILLMLMLL